MIGILSEICEHVFCKYCIDDVSATNRTQQMECSDDQGFDPQFNFHSRSHDLDIDYSDL